MDPTEHQEMCNFLVHQKYPDHLAHSINLKRSYRRKASKFRSGEKNVLYQVSFQ